MEDIKKAVVEDSKEVIDDVRAELKDEAKKSIKEFLFGGDEPEDKGIVGEHKKKIIGGLAAGAMAAGLSVSVSNTDNSVNHVGGDQIKTTVMTTTTSQKTDNSVDNSSHIDNSKTITTGDVHSAGNVSF